MIRNILSIVVGLVIGSIVNMSIVIAGSSLVTPPPGVDVSDPESMAQSIHLFEAHHFVTPFLAHALGTLAGALIAYAVAKSYKERFSYSVGGIFLIGGIAASFIIPAPLWFIATDLIFAYIPMAWISVLIGRRLVKQ